MPEWKTAVSPGIFKPAHPADKCSRNTTFVRLCNLINNDRRDIGRNLIYISIVDSAVLFFFVTLAGEYIFKMLEFFYVSLVAVLIALKLVPCNDIRKCVIFI